MGNTLACHLESPYRRHTELTRWSNQERENLKHHARTARPYHNVGFDKYNILILGPCQAGKSSLKSTLKSAFLGEVSYQSDVGHDITSLTKKYTIGPLRDRNGQELGHFRFADMPGVDFVNVDQNTIGGILEGKMKHNCEFIDGVIPSLDADQQTAERNKIHCIVMVLDGTKMEMMNGGGHIFDLLRHFRRQARQRDIPVAVVLTHLDQICECISDDLARVFTCKNAKEAIMSVVHPLGIDANRVFLIQNYSRIGNVEVDAKIDCLSLLTLKFMLQYCREYADSWLDANT